MLNNGGLHSIFSDEKRVILMMMSMEKFGLILAITTCFLVGIGSAALTSELAEPVNYTDIFDTISPVNYTDIFDTMEPNDYIDTFDTIAPVNYTDIFDTMEPVNYTDIFDTMEPVNYTDIFDTMEPVNYIEIFGSGWFSGYSPVNYIDIFDTMPEGYYLTNSYLIENAQTPIDNEDLLQSPGSTSIATQKESLTASMSSEGGKWSFL
jgi:hypothetical protein